MNVLMVHQNFPGQFKHLAPALAAAGHRVVAMPLKETKEVTWQGVELHPYKLTRGSTPGIHPWLVDLETKTLRAQACFEAALALREQGFNPDVIVAHPGWGESLLLKDVWPEARLGVYCEFFYRATGLDVGFDPEFFAARTDDGARLRYKNLNTVMHFEHADAGIAPTQWQASTFPQPFSKRISVVHDGIDTQRLAPNPGASLTLKSASGTSVPVSRDDEIITYVSRNLEPYRGYHVLMRALPELLRRRPRARVIIVGGDRVGYGAKPPQGTWKTQFIDEVRASILDDDWARVHFVGTLPYVHYLSLLQISRVHVYLTYPFVLSWSLLEAMSVGCAIVASDTPPVREVIQHNDTGRLVGFFDAAALVDAVCALAEDADLRRLLGTTARTFACEHYDLQTRCLPRQLEWVESLAQGSA